MHLEFISLLFYIEKTFKMIQLCWFANNLRFSISNQGKINYYKIK